MDKLKTWLELTQDPQVMAALEKLINTEEERPQPFYNLGVSHLEVGFNQAWPLFLAHFQEGQLTQSRLKELAPVFNPLCGSPGIGNLRFIFERRCLIQASGISKTNYLELINTTFVQELYKEVKEELNTTPDLRTLILQKRCVIPNLLEWSKEIFGFYKSKSYTRIIEHLTYLEYINKEIYMPDVRLRIKGHEIECIPPNVLVMLKKLEDKHYDTSII